MAWIYLPKTLYQYKREAGSESRFDRYRPSYKQKRRRYQQLFHTFWLLLFLTFCITLAKVSMLAIRSHKFDGFRPLAKSAEQIKEGRFLRIWIDSQHRILVNKVTAKTYDDFAYLVYDAYLKYPNHNPLLIADVRVNMDIIHYAIKVLRIAGYKKVYFKASMH